MKRLTLIFTVMIASFVVAVNCHAGFRVGPRFGVDISSLRFNKDIFNQENRLGFTAGLQGEVNLPLGLGFDASVMYVHRDVDGIIHDGENSATVSLSRDYLNIPVNFKWRFVLPKVSSIIIPYIFTGPDFAFLTSNSKDSTVWSSGRKVDIAWNVGLGIELIRHLQISGTCGMGMTKLVNTDTSNAWVSGLDGRNNKWTVTAAWLF